MLNLKIVKPNVRPINRPALHAVLETHREAKPTREPYPKQEFRKTEQKDKHALLAQGP